MLLQRLPNVGVGKLALAIEQRRQQLRRRGSGSLRQKALHQLAGQLMVRVLGILAGAPDLVIWRTASHGARSRGNRARIRPLLGDVEPVERIEHAKR